VWTSASATWRYNNALKPAGLQGEDRVLRASADAWRAAGVNFSFTMAGATDAGTGACHNESDGANTVAGAAQENATLAVTCSWYNADHHATEFDMEIDPDWAWTTADTNIKVDLQSVITHEFGHALGIGHSADQSAVMYASYASGVNKRTLQPEDISGAVAMYGTATAPPPPQFPARSELPITPGANLLTWPGADASPQKALGDQSASVVAIYAYDSATKTWSRYAPGVPDYVNNLVTLRRGAAYWFVARGAAVITAYN
jgi:hypothetical protein